MKKLFFLIIASVLFLQGCTIALYPKSAPLEKKEFNAGGKTIFIFYSASAFTNLPDYTESPHSMETGKRMSDIESVIKKYGFVPYDWETEIKKGVAPDFILRITETGTFLEGDPPIGLSILLGGLTAGVIPFTFNSHPMNIKYDIFDGKNSLGEISRENFIADFKENGNAHSIGAALYVLTGGEAKEKELSKWEKTSSIDSFNTGIHVKGFTGLYSLFLGSLNNLTFRKAISKEHERALLYWIDAGVFE